MHKKAGLVFISIGAVLMVSALLLLMNNEQEDEAAGEASREMLEEVLLMIEENRDSPAETEEAEPEPEEVPAAQTETPEEAPAETEAEELLLTKLSAEDYIGVLVMPTLELELPVLSEWDYEKLKAAPCRQFGSTAEDDLVIAAHNYKQHFGKLGLLAVGDEVQMIDMDGTVNEYEVKETGTIAATAVNEVQNSEYDLILYTCTYSGDDRIAVFLERN